MTPEEFIAKWRNATANETKFYQSHFYDLCRLLEVDDPIKADPSGRDYCFEKAVQKSDGAPGRADVWKRGHFVWEYKGTKKHLTAAQSQAKQYAGALDNPPLLIVSDAQEIRILTNFTNEVAVTHTIKIIDLNDWSVRKLLKACWTDPEFLRPKETRATVTAKAAAKVGTIAGELRRRLGDEQSRRVAHFLNRIVFCLFSQYIGLLPDLVFSDLLEESLGDQPGFSPRLRNLFRAMKDPQGYFGSHKIPWFNGGLFDDDDVIDLDGLQLRDLFDAAKLDWGNIEPSIFGTLFERGLDPEKRKAMAGLFDLAPDAAPAKPAAKAKGLTKADKGVGIHYTDPEKIMKIVEPVVLRPLRAEWDQVKEKVAALRAKRDAAKDDAVRTRHENVARDTYQKFRHRLGKFRVLDPACGSGNFLYMALMHLKDLDRAIEAEARTLGLPADGERITPQCVLGIEINPYAAELARTTVWIGELQWQVKNAGAVNRTPILGSLKGIENRDALLNEDGTEAQWPKADAIVGNPPFLGDKLMIGALGENYTRELRDVYRGRLSGQADFVCYWFLKAMEVLDRDFASFIGFVSTNSITKGANNEILKRIYGSYDIYDAWSDEGWSQDGVGVRVSLVCFARVRQTIRILNGEVVTSINSSLGKYKSLDGRMYEMTSNLGIAMQGITKGGKFELDQNMAYNFLSLSVNPNGKSNGDVVRRWINGDDVCGRSRNMWIIDFTGLEIEQAAYYEAPFKYVLDNVYSSKQLSSRKNRRERWHHFNETAPSLRRALLNFKEVIVTPEVSKHRFFCYQNANQTLDKNLVVFCRDDLVFFGILESSFHRVWSIRTGSSLLNNPRYTSSTTFRTFPFPEGLTPDIPASAYADDPRAQAIAAAAKELNEKREAWLNPPDLVTIVPEVVPGYPDRILPKNDKAAAELKKRTLTNLYNQRPAWLDMLHKRLDAAVAAAYGWPADISEEDALARLFALNQERAAKQGTAPAAGKRAGGKPRDQEGEQEDA